MSAQTTYQVGTYYKVPCVYGRIHNTIDWWPVIGEFHEDAEHINFPEWHWHLDARFLSDRQLAAVGMSYMPKTDAARRWPLMLKPHGDAFTPMAELLFAPGDHPKPVLKRRLCKRQWEDSLLVDGAKWLPSLESAFAGVKMKKLVCPHRGADLSTLPIDEQGCVECPLHGLRWRVATGELVTRADWRANDCRRAA